MSGTFRGNVGLLFVLGVVLTLGFNLWRLIQPYTQPPPRPEFPSAAKAKTPPPPQAVSPPPTTAPKVEEEKPEVPAIGKGKVVPDIGLVLRESPSSESGGSSGVPFNAEISILEETEDGEWLKIRDDSTGATGWVRSANIDRVF
ncbi:MAG: SH3 domain-containing protein [Pseudanabaenaceae cyanobacterium SKYGB_i_bin29]|nr:SH3 domain-containing protein [Pseudanabaenaceae cyanobacterium SKYG29]MDW8420580.1 SH3 domain-containing protein [Pseudanabaenaceae cyanobacterium SKYGB_i_bin29]